MDDLILTTGKESAAKLPGRAGEVHELIKANFPAKSLAQLQEEFEKSLTANGAANTPVAALSAMVREQAALTIEDIKNLEMWLFLKVPEVSDGNNFGVDVQNFVLESLKALRAEVVAMLGCVAEYHASRAGILEKIVRPVTKTVDEESKNEKDGDKTTVKSSKTEKTSSKEEAPLPDKVKELAAVDVKEYHACYLKLTDIRNAYFKAHLMMSKNKKRLTDPRGDGEGSRSNAMSMF